MRSYGAMVLLSGLAACGEPEPYWAVQHAEVTMDGDSFTGHQTWEFYSKRWRRNQTEDHHICARIQVIDGSLTDSMEGCKTCDAVYSISMSELETDCEHEVGTKKSFASASHFALGPLTGELEDQDIYDAEQGWYVSWDSTVLEPLGYAWAGEDSSEGSDTGDVQTVESLILWPGYAWKL